MDDIINNDLNGNKNIERRLRNSYGKSNMLLGSCTGKVSIHVIIGHVKFPHGVKLRLFMLYCYIQHAIETSCLHSLNGHYPYHPLPALGYIVMTSSNGNIFRVTGALCGEYTGHRWCGALMFSLICVWINGWVNNREAGDLRRHRAHYEVTVMH